MPRANTSSHPFHPQQETIRDPYLFAGATAPVRFDRWERHCAGICGARPGRRLVDAVGSAAPGVLESIQGPVAKIVAVIIIIATGLALAFGDTSGGFRRLIQIVFGLSIAFAASSFFLSFFSFGGGALV